MVEIRQNAAGRCTSLCPDPHGVDSGISRPQHSGTEHHRRKNKNTSPSDARTNCSSDHRHHKKLTPSPKHRPRPSSWRHTCPHPKLQDQPRQRSSDVQCAIHTISPELTKVPVWRAYLSANHNLDARNDLANKVSGFLILGTVSTREKTTPNSIKQAALRLSAQPGTKRLVIHAR